MRGQWRKQEGAKEALALQLSQENLTKLCT